MYIKYICIINRNKYILYVIYYNLQSKFVDTVLPREVKCYKDQPCLIPFTVKGHK
jgi:hypothetical protein